MKIRAFTLLACGVALSCLSSGSAYAQSANASANPPAYTGGTQSLSQQLSGGLRTQPQDGAGHDVSPAHPLPIMSAGSDGQARTILTSSSATACTSLQTTSGYLVNLVNTGPATTVFLTLYDEGASPTCAAADLIYGDGTSLTIGAGQVIRFPIPLTNGLAYKLSGALTNNLVIVRN